MMVMVSNTVHVESCQLSLADKLSLLPSARRQMNTGKVRDALQL